MITNNKLDLLSRLRNLRLQRKNINNEIKYLLEELKKENKNKMTKKQLKSIHKAREVLYSKTVKKNRNNKS